MRDNVFWDDQRPPTLTAVNITSVDDEGVRYGSGRKDKFRNPRVAGGFIVNSTELRAVNFSMDSLDQPRVQPHRNGRRAARVGVPLPKRYGMHKDIDAEIRERCW